VRVGDDSIIDKQHHLVRPARVLRIQYRRLLEYRQLRRRLTNTMSDNILEDREARSLFGEELEDFSSEDEEDEGPSLIDQAMAIIDLAQIVPVPPVDPMEWDSGTSSSSSARSWGGSLPGKAGNKSRNFQEAKQRLMRMYFNGAESTYDEHDFERRFRMSREVFAKVKDAVIGEPPFTVTVDATGKPGIDPLVRLVACLRRLAYGTAGDMSDETFEISKSVVNRDTKVLCRIIKHKFGGTYLNSIPKEEVLVQVQAVNAGRGFPGMLASWDCKHFPWEQCPVALQGQHKSGKEPGPSVILEAICDPHLYIWYHFFGEPGSLNDINILQKSSIVLSIFNGSLDLKTPPYVINGCKRNYGYFLVDGIYPSWSIFVDTFNHPENDKETHFAMCQEGCRKDIERAFGVLVKKWKILQQPLRLWFKEDLSDILDTCIIFHNMVVEEKRFTYAINDWVQEVQRNEGNQEQDQDEPQLAQVSLFGIRDDGTFDPTVMGPLQSSLRGEMLVTNYDDEYKHQALKSDLVEHNWSRKN